MTVWSVTTDTDAGIFTSLHKSEEDAFVAFAETWFPVETSTPEDAVNLPDALRKDELLTALGLGTAQASTWIESYIDNAGGDARVVIQAHTLI